MRDFAIVFDGNAEQHGEARVTESFAEKWGWFAVMYRLCNAQIWNLETITKLNLMEAFTWLSYEVDLESTKKVNINGNT